MLISSHCNCIIGGAFFSKHLHSFVADLLRCTDHSIWCKAVWVDSTWHLEWATELRPSGTLAWRTEVLESHCLHRSCVTVYCSIVWWRWPRPNSKLTSLDLCMAQFEMVWLEASRMERDFKFVQVLRAELNLAFKTDQVFQHRGFTAHRNGIKLELRLAACLLGCQVLEQCCIFE